MNLALGLLVSKFHQFLVQFIKMDGSEFKRRRIVVEDEDDEEVISNPDEFNDDMNDPDDEEGEDIMVNWRT